MRPEVLKAHGLGRQPSRPLYVSADGEIVCKDEDTDSTPVVAFTSEERARVTLNLSMVSVKKPSFAVAAVLVAQED